MTGWAYFDANGTPLRGPCLGHPRCTLMSEPGGKPHAGPCMAGYTEVLRRKKGNR